MMKIETTRFGTIDIEKDKIINFKKGILGFPEDRRYVLIPHRKDSPFFWLQSVDSPGLAFVVINPAIIVSDYSFDIDDETEKMLEIDDPKQVDVMVIVTINSDKDGKKVQMSANLLGPVVVNVDKRIACQVVLDPNKYPVRYEFG